MEPFEAQNPCEVSAGRSCAACAVCVKCGRELSAEVASTFVAESTLKSAYDAPEPYCATYGAAIDLGTTTIVLALCRASDGAVLSTMSCVNPQRAVSPDVMGRIGAALDGAQGELQDMATNAIERLLLQACEEARVSPELVDAFVVTGNTAMLHLLFGEDVAGLSRMPFTMKRGFGEEMQLLGRKAYVPACFGPFLGADLACAILSSGLTERAHPSLLCDIGTNGEMAIWKDGFLYLASAPAGPCFEGAGLSCGCGSIAGAVDGVSLAGGELQVHVIGDERPVGICGSGVIEAVDAFVQAGSISEGGRIFADPLTVCDGVALSQTDVRAVQLAKAAIAAGIEIIMDAAGASASTLDALYVCGGFGSHMNLAAAARIGLIPRGLLEKASALGNAALEGAVMALLDRGKMTIMENMRDMAQCVSLVGNDRFEESYVDNMAFDQGEEANGAE